MESSSSARPDEDISAAMTRRARCIQKTRYSFEAALNVRMFSHKLSSSSTINEVILLRGLLFWFRKLIHRIERICADAEAMDREAKPLVCTHHAQQNLKLRLLAIALMVNIRLCQLHWKSPLRFKAKAF